jgi:hypothetical protein
MSLWDARVDREGADEDRTDRWVDKSREVQQRACA